MKKAMSLVTALTICALQCPSIASAQEDDYSAYFADKSEINCVAIGGSITAAGGVSASWGSKVSTWLGEKTGKKVNFYNAGIGGTGSDFGITRLYDDVVSRDPDIVFVEFSVNDRAIYNESATDASGEADTEIVFNADLGKYVLPTDADGNEYLIYNGKKYTYTLNEGKRAVVKRDMEAITRQLLALPKRPVIIYNYVGFGENHIANTSSDDNRIGRLVMPRACIDVHEEIAEKYGIPSINIDSYIQNIMVNGAAALDANTYTQNEIYSSTDCIHPNTTVGTTLYAEYMEKVISENPEKYLTVSAADVNTKEKESNNIYDDTFHTVPFTEAEFSGSGWKEASYNGKQHLKTSDTGDTISFDFSGKVVFVRGAQIGNRFNITITNANEDGSDYIEDVAGYKNADTQYDILWKKADLKDGEHKITITRLDYPSADAGNLAICGIAVNGAIPEGGFKSLTDFRDEHPEFAKTIGGFESNFDGDLKSSFVDAGWEVYNDAKQSGDDITVDVKDGRLVMYGGKSTAVKHGLDENESDIIYLSYEASNTDNVGLRLADGADINTKERLGMLKGNPAGVWLRDGAGGNGTAARFSDTDAYWPEAGVMHKYELIFNFKNNEQMLFIDGVEAVYKNGQASASGNGVTVKGTSLGGIYLFMGDNSSESKPIYLDNFIVKSYSDYVSAQIMALNFYADDALETLAKLEKDAAYLSQNGKNITAAAQEKLDTARTEIEKINAMTPAFDASDLNSNLVGAKELFTLKDGIEVSSITLDEKELTEGTDYEVNGAKYLFDGQLFAASGSKALKATAADGTEYLNKIEIRNPEKIMILTHSDNTEKAGTSHATNAAVKGYSGNSANIFQVYVKDVSPYVKWLGRENFAGTYSVDWFDINATINSTQYAQPKLNAEIKSKAGTKSFSFDTTRDDSWHNIGTYTFNGTEDEYIKVLPGSTVDMGAGMRFFAEVIRLSESYDDNVLLSEFASLPQEITIEIADGGYTGVAKVATLSETVDEKFISELNVDGSQADFEMKDNKILIPENVLSEEGEHSVYLELINGTKSNTVTFTLTAPGKIDYPLSAAELSEGIGTVRAGAGHSRYGKEGTTKVTPENIVAPEGTSLDDYMYVKWEIGNIAEGDYLVDTWLPSGWLGTECKVLVVSDGGEKETVYHSLHANNLTETVDMHTEFYLGNGAKIHFTGNGSEYIKIMPDDDWAAHGGRYLMIDSVRLTPWYDMDSIYNDFYGDGVIQKGESSVKDNVVYQSFTSKYAMHKYGYTAILAVYDADGRLTDCVRKNNIMLYDGDTTMEARFNLADSRIDLTGKTYKVFLWGGDAEPDNDTAMVSYVK